MQPHPSSLPKYVSDLWKVRIIISAPNNRMKPHHEHPLLLNCSVCVCVCVCCSHEAADYILIDDESRPLFIL